MRYARLCAEDVFELNHLRAMHLQPQFFILLHRRFDLLLRDFFERLASDAPHQGQHPLVDADQLIEFDSLFEQQLSKLSSSRRRGGEAGVWPRA